MKTFVIFIILFLFSVNSVFAWTDLCEYAKETPHMTNINFEKFFEDKLKGNNFSGSGAITNVRSYGPSEYVVIVDCNNRIVANVIVSSSSVKEFKIGDKVEFSGKCAHGFRRGYSSTLGMWTFFELQDGDVK